MTSTDEGHNQVNAEIEFLRDNLAQIDQQPLDSGRALSAANIHRRLSRLHAESASKYDEIAFGDEATDVAEDKLHDDASGSN